MVDVTPSHQWPDNAETGAPRIRLEERPPDKHERIWCSFCGRHDGECRVMVAGEMGAAICDSCIRIAHLTLNDYDGEAEYQSWMKYLTPNVI